MRSANVRRALALLNLALDHFWLRTLLCGIHQALLDLLFIQNLHSLVSERGLHLIRLLLQELFSSAQVQGGICVDEALVVHLLIFVHVHVAHALAEVKLLCAIQADHLLIFDHAFRSYRGRLLQSSDYGTII